MREGGREGREGGREGGMDEGMDEWAVRSRHARLAIRHRSGRRVRVRYRQRLYEYLYWTAPSRR